MMSTTLVYHTVDIFVPDELSEGAGKMIVKLKENANKLFSTELRILPIFSIFFFIGSISSYSYLSDFLSWPRITFVIST